MDSSALCDAPLFLMLGTINLLWFLQSPYLLLAERICNFFSIVAALQLYIALNHMTWIYQLPRHFADQKVMAHHMNFVGLSTLIMTIVKAPFVRQDKVDRDVVLRAVAASLLVDVFGYIPLIKSAKEFVGDMMCVYLAKASSLSVASIVLFL
jgi:hypothetical protein